MQLKSWVKKVDHAGL